MGKRELWVVEVRWQDDWLPTTGAHLTRKQARHDLEWWRDGNPDDRYRIWRYVAEEGRTP